MSELGKKGWCGLASGSSGRVVGQRGVARFVRKKRDVGTAA